MPTYPVTSVGSRRPKISQAWKAGDHLGVDIMFARLPSDPPHEASNPRGTKGHYVPEGVMCVATQAGRVVYAKWAANGYRVRIATEDGYEELHLHLENLFVTEGEDVYEGQPLGLMGGDPTSADPHHTVHLHYERRLNNVPEDPARYLAGASGSSAPSSGGSDGFDLAGIDLGFDLPDASTAGALLAVVALALLVIS